MSAYEDILNGVMSSGDAANLVESLQSKLYESQAQAAAYRHMLERIVTCEGSWDSESGKLIKSVEDSSEEYISHLRK